MSGHIDLSKFDNRSFPRGASYAKEATWLAVRSAAFEHGFWPMSGIRARLLRMYGASLGEGVVIRRGMRVHFPWRLKVGNNCWLGEEAWLLNLDSIELGDNVVVSQRAFLCTGNHDWTDPAFALRTAPIRVEAGSWIGAGAFVGPGTVIGQGTVVTAGSVVTGSLPPNMVCSGNPCRPVKPRIVE